MPTHAERVRRYDACRLIVSGSFSPAGPANAHLTLKSIDLCVLRSPVNRNVAVAIDAFFFKGALSAIDPGAWLPTCCARLATKGGRARVVERPLDALGWWKSRGTGQVHRALQRGSGLRRRSRLLRQEAEPLSPAWEASLGQTLNEWSGRLEISSPEAFTAVGVVTP